MRNIPVFTTQNGAASLTLSEIPYTQTAYIRIQDSQQIREFIEECSDFCRAVGAQHVYATGHKCLADYPLHTRIVRMCRLREGLADTDAAIFPVQKETLEKWRKMYNEKMREVNNSTYMTQAKAEEYLKKGNAYFIHRDNTLLGFGAASGEMVEALGSVVSGAGEDVLLALNHALSADRIYVEVATTNSRAVRLYQRLGFMETEEISAWYKIF